MGEAYEGDDKMAWITLFFCILVILCGIGVFLGEALKGFCSTVHILCLLENAKGGLDRLFQ